MSTDRRQLLLAFSVFSFVSFVSFVSSVPAEPVVAAEPRSIQPPALHEALSAARKLVDAGQPRAAIEKLNAVRDTDDPLVAELLGVAYFHANDPARAIERLTPVVTRLAPGSLERREAVQVLGLSHYVAGHLAESIPYLEEVRPLVPDDVKLAYALGMAYAQTRQPDKARESFARTFRVEPDSAAGLLENLREQIVRCFVVWIVQDAAAQHVFGGCGLAGLAVGLPEKDVGTAVIRVDPQRLLQRRDRGVPFELA